MSRFSCLLALPVLLATTPASALVEPKSGTEYPDRIDVGTPAGQVTLIATGTGLREKTLMKVDVYTIVSYVDDQVVLGASPAAAILTLDAPKRLRMDMRRDVDRGRLVDTLTRAIAANFEDRAPIAADLERFLNFFEQDAHDGDTIIFDYAPRVGLTTSVNGKVMGVIEHFTFVTALWSVWFGEHPDDDQLKRALVSNVQR